MKLSHVWFFYRVPNQVSHNERLFPHGREFSQKYCMKEELCLKCLRYKNSVGK